MDFEKLLCVARKNELTKKEPVKCLQTKFKPPTKEQHERDKILSEGVQKFLARKEEEEQKKQKEAEKRKLELMALRAKDPKASRRIQTMLKRTKSANKSVMEDAVDNYNTADTLSGPSQPDEDDYGFVSETSSQLYNKLIQKMYSTPSDDVPKFAPSKKPNSGNLSNTKERVKMALLKQEEEEKLPHKKKKKSRGKKDDDEETVFDSSPVENESINASEPIKEKVKIKKAAPPPVDFHELLKIAEKKQHEPIVFEPKVKKSQEPEILMTKKQRLEHEKLQEWKRQRELRLQSLENGDKSPLNGVEKKSIPKIPKLNQSNSDQKATTSQKKLNGQDEKMLSNKTNLKNQDRNDKNVTVNKLKDPSEKNQKLKCSTDRKVPSQASTEKKHRDLDDETSRLIKERDDALRLLKEKERLIQERDEAVRILKEKEQLIKERDEVFRKLKLLEQSEKMKSGPKTNLKPPDTSSSKSGAIIKKGAASDSKVITKNFNGAKSSSSKIDSVNVNSNSAFSKNVSISKTNLKPANKNSSSQKCEVREFPPRDVKPRPKSLNSATDRNHQRQGKRFPPADVRQKSMALKRRRIESDDEYDSELDDFIDDDTHDMGPEDVSRVISEIFRYDKNKYSKYDDGEDDECMESNFAQISKEEYFSAKCGLLEDLQDIQREKAKLARKQKR